MLMGKSIKKMILAFFYLKFLVNSNKALTFALANEGNFCFVSGF